MSDPNGQTLGRRKGGLFGERVSDVVAQEMLQEIAGLRQTMTEWAAQLSGRMFNKTLLVETVVFPSSGVFMRDFGAAAGSVRVTPLGAGDVTVVANGGGDNVAPTQGVGVSVVRPANPDTIAVASTTMTFYGTAAESVSIQVFAGAVTP